MAYMYIRQCWTMHFRIIFFRLFLFVLTCSCPDYDICEITYISFFFVAIKFALVAIVHKCGPVDTAVS